MPFEWMGSTKTQTGLILQKATHLDIIREMSQPPMLIKKKKFFLLPRTKNSYLTKERLSDYAIKRKDCDPESQPANIILKY